MDIQSNLLDTAAVWAMEPEALDAHFRAAISNAQQLQAFHGSDHRAAHRPYEVKGGAAIIPVTGTLVGGSFRFNFWFLRATGYEWIAEAVRLADRDDEVQRIALSFDSGGGVICGGLQVAVQAIESVSKPIAAHIYGSCCSAAMPLAHAAGIGNVIASPTSALIGCLGAMYSIRRVEHSDIKVIEYRFVSKQTPRKNADPATKEGAAAWQRLADDHGESFLKLVGRLRQIGDEADAIAEQFGRGRTVSPVEALEMGLIDRIDSLDLEAEADTNGGIEAATEEPMPTTDKDGAGLFAAQIERLTGERDGAKAELEKAKADAANWKAAAETAKASADELRKGLKALEEERDSIAAERDRLKADVEEQKASAVKAEANREFDQLFAAGDFSANEREGYVKAFVMAAGGDDTLMKFGFESRKGQGLAAMGLKRNGQAPSTPQTHGADPADARINATFTDEAVEAQIQDRMKATGEDYLTAMGHIGQGMLPG